MSAETNARDYANAFYHWQSPVQRPTHMDEASLQLRDLVELRKATQALIDEEVANLRFDGMTWEKISDAMGVSRQTVQRKYAPKG